jgi:hypothetical protein
MAESSGLMAKQSTATDLVTERAVLTKTSRSYDKKPRGRAVKAAMARSHGQPADRAWKYGQKTAWKSFTGNSLSTNAKRDVASSD